MVKSRVCELLSAPQSTLSSTQLSQSELSRLRWINDEERCNQSSCSVRQARRTLATEHAVSLMALDPPPCLEDVSSGSSLLSSFQHNLSKQDDDAGLFDDAKRLEESARGFSFGLQAGEANSMIQPESSSFECPMKATPPSINHKDRNPTWFTTDISSLNFPQTPPHEMIDTNFPVTPPVTPPPPPSYPPPALQPDLQTDMSTNSLSESPILEQPQSIDQQASLDTEKMRSLEAERFAEDLKNKFDEIYSLNEQLMELKVSQVNLKDELVQYQNQEIELRSKWMEEKEENTKYLEQISYLKERLDASQRRELALDRTVKQYQEKSREDARHQQAAFLLSQEEEILVGRDKSVAPRIQCQSDSEEIRKLREARDHEEWARVELQKKSDGLEEQLARALEEKERLMERCNGLESDKAALEQTGEQLRQELAKTQLSAGQLERAERHVTILSKQAEDVHHARVLSGLLDEAMPDLKVVLHLLEHYMSREGTLDVDFVLNASSTPQEYASTEPRQLKPIAEELSQLGKQAGELRARSIYHLAQRNNKEEHAPKHGLSKGDEECQIQ